MSEPTAPSAAQDGAPGTTVPVADIYADVDPSVPRANSEPADAGAHC